MRPAPSPNHFSPLDYTLSTPVFCDKPDKVCEVQPHSTKPWHTFTLSCGYLQRQFFAPRLTRYSLLSFCNVPLTFCRTFYQQFNIITKTAWLESACFYIVHCHAYLLFMCKIFSPDIVLRS